MPPRGRHGFQLPASRTPQGYRAPAMNYSYRTPAGARIQAGARPAAPRPAAAGLSASGVAPQRPTASIWTDPTYLAYRSALGLEGDTAVAQLRGAQDAARRQAAQSVADLTFQGGEQRRGISGNFESRGVIRSGGYERALAVQRANEGRQLAGITSGLGDRLAELEGQIAASRAAQARQMAGSIWDAAGRSQQLAYGMV